MATNGLTERRYNVIMKMLQAIAKREGISGAKIELLKGSEKGDGFIGEKNLAILRGDNKTSEFFIKCVPSDEALRKALDLRLIYLMEILFYREIIPTFVEFQTKKNIPIPFTSVIECVDTCTEIDDELLILRNAKSLGFELRDKMKQMNKEHVEFVYTEYAKFHGLSYALKDQQPKLYEGLVNQFPFNALEMLGDKMMDGLLRMAEMAKVLFDPQTEGDLYNSYCSYVNDVPEFMKTIAHQKDKYSVIVHGDCWSNNMMFKYEPGSNKVRPIQMCLFDFQIGGEGSPVFDLAYFMHASSPKDIYDNLDHYLHIYHDSLTKTIRDLGSDPEQLLPFEELKNQWKMYSKFGLMMAIVVLKICVQEQDETVELSESLEETGGDMLAGFAKESKNDDIYNLRLKNLIVHMVENKFI